MTMKKLCFPLLALLLLVLTSQGNAAILIGSLSPVLTAQTNSTTFQTNTAQVTLPQVTVSNNNLSTNIAYSGFFRWSFDGVNFFTNSSPVFTPASTNAGSSTISPQTVSVPIYVQMLAITNLASTLPIQIGITSP